MWIVFPQNITNWNIVMLSFNSQNCMNFHNFDLFKFASACKTHHHFAMVFREVASFNNKFETLRVVNISFKILLV